MSKETAVEGNTEALTNEARTAQAADPNRQLHEIRDLLFGEQLRSVHQRTEELEYRLQKQLQDMTTAFGSALEQLQDDTRRQLTELSQRVDSLDEKHTQQTTNLAQDIAALSGQVTEKYQALADKLAATSNDLKNNKTDRKMLASLLSGMANNLSVDEQL
jgi:DNA anti-recombination protein RmuC